MRNVTVVLRLVTRTSLRHGKRRVRRLLSPVCHRLLVFESNRVVTSVKKAIGIVGLEIRNHPFEREIGEDAMIHQVFHVLLSPRIDRLKQSI